MIGWLKLTDEQRRVTLEQAFLRTNIQVEAIEKDWWVTLSLKALYNTPYAGYCIFKGGTSLSKGQKLIDRFSEDIDIALDPLAFDMEYKTDPSVTYVKKLKRHGCAFTTVSMKEALEQAFTNLGIPQGVLTVGAKEIPADLPDTDPQTLYVKYTSLFDPHPYLDAEVKMEFGVRALKDPVEIITMQSILHEAFPNPVYHETPFMVTVVEPRKTLLEKMFLLHEKFQQPQEKVLQDARQSRHLYDIYQLINSPVAEDLLSESDFYKILLYHRERYVRLPGIDYATLHWHTLSFIPPPELLDHFKSDYRKMEVMIHGKRPGFEEMMQQLKYYNGRIRLMGTSLDLGFVINEAIKQNQDTFNDFSKSILHLQVNIVNSSGETFQFLITMNRNDTLSFESVEWI